VVLTNGRTVSTSSHALSQKLDEFTKLVCRIALKLRTEAQDSQAKELATLDSYVERIDEQLLRIQDTLGAIQTSNTSETEALGVARKVLEETHEWFRTSFSAWNERLTTSCEEMCTSVKQAGTEAFVALEAELRTMSSLFDATVREVLERIDFECNAVREANILTSGNSENELIWLKQQNETLLALLESERQRGDEAKEKLARRLSALLDGFMAEKNKNLQEAIDIIQSGIEQREEDARLFDVKHSKIMEVLEKSGVEGNKLMQRRVGEGKRTRDGAFKVCSQSKLLTFTFVHMRLDTGQREGDIEHKCRKDARAGIWFSRIVCHGAAKTNGRTDLMRRW
jgi:kinesin family protein 11